VLKLLARNQPFAALIRGHRLGVDHHAAASASLEDFAILPWVVGATQGWLLKTPSAFEPTQQIS